MRPMALEFPDDRAAAYLDTQYMLGDDLLVAPVFSADGRSSSTCRPGAGRTGSRARRSTRAAAVAHRDARFMLSLPLYVREGAVIPIGAATDRPDHDYLDGLELKVYPGPDGRRSLTVTAPDGRAATFTVARSGGAVTAASDSGVVVTTTVV